MKRLYSAVAALTMTMAIGGTVIAQTCPNDGGCSNCSKGNLISRVSPDGVPAGENDIYRQFRINTLDLRQEMMLRRFEVQRENLKATPDTRKVAALKADIAAIQARISEIRVQSGLPEDGKRDGECYKPDGGCGKQNGLGGCNGGPCWQK